MKMKEYLMDLQEEFAELELAIGFGQWLVENGHMEPISYFENYNDYDLNWR